MHTPRLVVIDGALVDTVTGLAYSTSPVHVRERLDMVDCLYTTLTKKVEKLEDKAKVT